MDGGHTDGDAIKQLLYNCPLGMLVQGIMYEIDVLTLTLQKKALSKHIIIISEYKEELEYT